MPTRPKSHQAAEYLPRKQTHQEETRSQSESDSSLEVPNELCRGVERRLMCNAQAGPRQASVIAWGWMKRRVTGRIESSEQQGRLDYREETWAEEEWGQKNKEHQFLRTESHTITTPWVLIRASPWISQAIRTGKIARRFLASRHMMRWGLGHWRQSTDS